MLAFKNGEPVFDEHSAWELDQFIVFLEKKNLLNSFSESIVTLSNQGKSVGENVLKLIDRDSLTK